ncbi:hypothetical protein [Aliivibrio fischeri]|uniref:hypothetical protein n=1 Tax=Aliivibrio fischeri TaxID=668 RepID=UPI0012D92D57|nr:hypothetical protein [Aliivibrio fischeri]MUI54379.1 hypothetical protein [Aliivibrio fischeri]
MDIFNIKKALHRRIWQFFVALSEVAIITSILLATIIIILLFDDSPIEGMGLLPEWGAIAFFASLDALKKQMRVINSQDLYHV